MKSFLLIFVCFFIVIQNISASEKPELLLLKRYTEDTNVTSWQMSEKLDGVRAYWDGEKLMSRSGRVLAIPSFFIKNFPKHKLDGELWSKRGDFANIISIVNRKKPHDGWSSLTYNIFEVPNVDGNLTQRLSKVKTTKYIKVIKQIEIKDKKDLQNFVKKVEMLGGEGVVVRDASLDYYTGRTNKALKVKSFIDDECVVVGYNKGQGKYDGVVGSLSCRMKNMQVIKIGSGLDEHQRAVPPKLGAVVTFKYYGLTSKGNPRFPIFLRVRK